MMELLTFGVLVFTGLTGWQIFFQKNIMLFDRKNEAHKNLSVEFNKFCYLAERYRKDPFMEIKAASENKLREYIAKKKNDILQVFCNLEGIIDITRNLFHSRELNSELIKTKDEAKKILDIIFNDDLKIKKFMMKYTSI